MDNIFYKNLDKAAAQKLVSQTLDGFDDGELFLEYSQSENISFDDGVIKNSSFNSYSGFGLRGVIGEVSSYAHSAVIDEASLNHASNVVKSIKGDAINSSNISPNISPASKKLYIEDNPIQSFSFGQKVEILGEIDAYLRAKSQYISQVSASLGGNWQKVEILRADGTIATDIRPLVHMRIGVVVERDGKMESGSYGCGGRDKLDIFVSRERWQAAADEALRQALVNLDARPAKAGELPVVLGNAWAGVLLHEAVGHGLEGDFNRKETSVYTGRMGQQVASRGVTVVDDGTMPNLRGSITIDDEGTPSNRNVLIEDGILVGYMQDRLNSRLMDVAPTGNGRRESYQHQPLPRMTNTFMEAGEASVEDMIKSVPNGIYGVGFGGGQVDITSGKFVFSMTEAYAIEDGKVTHPVKGATLIGNGDDVMNNISMIGNDVALDDGIGTCGKDGQGVPVGVGQPSMLVDKITVGGTDI